MTAGGNRSPDAPGNRLSVRSRFNTTQSERKASVRCLRGISRRSRLGEELTRGRTEGVSSYDERLVGGSGVPALLNGIGPVSTSAFRSVVILLRPEESGGRILNDRRQGTAQLRISFLERPQKRSWPVYTEPAQSHSSTALSIRP